MDNSADTLSIRLAMIAGSLALPGLGLPVDDVVALAVDLLVADRATPATVAVAALGPGATMRDAGDDIMEMFHEQGVDLPPPPVGEEAEYRAAVWVFGAGGMGVSEFSRWFYPHVPAWDDQDAVERELIVLLDGWENETDTTRREDIATTMRGIAAQASRDNAG